MAGGEWRTRTRMSGHEVMSFVLLSFLFQPSTVLVQGTT